MWCHQIFKRLARLGTGLMPALLIAFLLGCTGTRKKPSIYPEWQTSEHRTRLNYWQEVRGRFDGEKDWLGRTFNTIKDEGKQRSERKTRFSSAELDLVTPSSEQKKALTWHAERLLRVAEDLGDDALIKRTQQLKSEVDNLPEDAAGLRFDPKRDRASGLAKVEGDSSRLTRDLELALSKQPAETTRASAADVTSTRAAADTTQQDTWESLTGVNTRTAPVLVMLPNLNQVNAGVIQSFSVRKLLNLASCATSIEEGATAAVRNRGAILVRDGQRVEDADALLRMPETREQAYEALNRAAVQDVPWYLRYDWLSVDLGLAPAYIWEESSTYERKVSNDAPVILAGLGIHLGPFSLSVGDMIYRENDEGGFGNALYIGIGVEVFNKNLMFDKGIDPKGAGG